VVVVGPEHILFRAFSWAAKAKVGDLTARVSVGELENEGDQDHDARNFSLKANLGLERFRLFTNLGMENWMWAKQQCARRCGFSVAEAKLVQEAYVVYQGRGDPMAFIIRVFSGITFTN
jgi:hypothetical protein